jgi:CP family cyanate transporter-like MFS transporter
MPSTSAPTTPPRDAHDPALADELLPEPESGILPAPPAARPFVVALALIAVALNLRPALSSLGPVLPEVMQAVAISSTTASILTMAPVLCLGLFGFITPRLAGRFGAERTVVGALLLLASGIALRGVPVFPSLLAGTLIAGSGIGIAGVLLPSLVKRDFPRHASLMTGIYTMALCAGAATAAGLTVLLARWLDGWPAALAFWALPALAAALLWLPPARRRHGGGVRSPPYRVTGLWRDPLAWQVTVFMGLQSSLAYIVFGWLAPILRERGLDPVTAGLAVSATVIVQLSTALTAPVVAARRRTQGGVAVGVVMLAMVGLLGCLYAPITTMWLWIVVLGLGQGGCFAVALSLIVLRSSDAQVATHLSGMAQSVGYTFASMGPLLAGLLRDWSGGWDATGALFAAICLMAAAAGIGAGRARQVQAIIRPL